MALVDLPALAISIRQPWAWAIVHAGKDIENRSWSTKFRGRVCVHAAQGMTKGEYADASSFITSTLVSAPSQEWLLKWHGVCAAPYIVKRGGIIGTVEIVDCVAESESPWFFGRYGFVLRDPEPVEFIQVKGALGFFDWRKNMAATDAPEQKEKAND
tara:strand:+ start:4579 stop:5049 length:471 start_codon:yes stop_codon:yes gene_type:complete